MEYDEFRKRNIVKFTLDPRRFRILKLEEVPEFSDDILSVIKDRNEVTVIASDGADMRALAEEKYFRLVTFDLALPFNLTGFLSFITAALAKAKVPVFVISSYSTDHLLIREQSLSKALSALQENGIKQS